jgi:hypothetical protein
VNETNGHLHPLDDPDSTAFTRGGKKTRRSPKWRNGEQRPVNRFPEFYSKSAASDATEANRMVQGQKANGGVPIPGDRRH